MSIYNYLVKKPNGEILSMETYRNKVMLIVNTASKCQFTYQYEDMQKLYEKYKGSDVEIYHSLVISSVIKTLKMGKLLHHNVKFNSVLLILFSIKLK